jgi:hypothetical protein
MRRQVDQAVVQFAMTVGAKDDAFLQLLLNLGSALERPLPHIDHEVLLAGLKVVKVEAFVMAFTANETAAVLGLGDHQKKLLFALEIVLPVLALDVLLLNWALTIAPVLVRPDLLLVSRAVRLGIRSAVSSVCTSHSEEV